MAETPPSKALAGREIGRGDSLEDGLIADATGRHADPEMDGLSLYEKKALVVNRELAAQGMGRYQWMVFFLCGFGYFLDLL